MCGRDGRRREVRKTIRNADLIYDSSVRELEKGNIWHVDEETWVAYNELSHCIEMIEETDYCGLVSGRKTEKSELFKVFYGELKTAPMIKDCPLNIECKLYDIYELPTNPMYIGEIVAAYTEEKYLTDGKPDIKKINPFVLTMPDNSFWAVGEYLGKAWGIGKKLMKGGE